MKHLKTKPQSLARQNIGRRWVLCTSLAVTLVGILGAGPISAQPAAFPNKPLKILVPFTAGSGADVYARFFGKKLSEILAQPVIVENKPGAGGALSVQSLKSEPADGYTILMGSNSPIAVNVVTVKNLSYDPVADLRPVAGITRSMAVFMVSNDSPLKTIKDLEKRGREQPPLNSGTYSPGYQLAAAQFTSQAKAPFQTILYKGLSQTLTDVMGNQIDLAVVDSTGSVSTATSGKARALLVTGDARHPELPDVPTLKESGYPEAVHYSWTSFWVAAKTPDAVVNVLADAMQKALAQPDSKEFIEKTGAEVMPLGPDALRKFQLAEIERFRRAAQDSGFKPEE
jgi:tripartite-type tricarboxylate transporter receptor subunit TctC